MSPTRFLHLKTLFQSVFILQAKSRIMSEQPRKLVILAAGVNAVGHITGCSGTASCFLRRGHRVIYLLEQSFAGMLAPLGFEEHLYSVSKTQDKNSNPGERQAYTLFENGLMGPLSPLQKTKNYLNYFESQNYRDQQINLNRCVEEAIKKYSPDLIIFDANALMPAIYYSGIPWIKNISMTPIFYEIDDDLPPGGSGLPANGDRSQWSEYNEIRFNFINSSSFNDLVQQMGYSRFPDNWKSPPNSQLLTVYAYPDELDYPAIRKKGWFNLEVFHKKNPADQVQLDQVIWKHLGPKEFIDDNLDGKFSGKLILLTMGSMGSIDLDLMRRLVGALGKTSHKFVVSKGPRHAEYDLPRNMWGVRFLPQLKIIPSIDLVITHGGNNTVTETFSMGVPMIVLPLFTDQFDNAQRLQETGFGTRVDPYTFTEQELICAVDKLLYDEELKGKLKAASKRIQSEDRHEQLVLKVQRLLLK